MKRLAMRKIRDALRLAAEGHSARLIGASLDVGRTTVQEYLSRAKAAGLSWPLPEDLDDEALEAQLFPSVNGSVSQHAHPDWVAVHRELKRPHVTLQLLWQEYRAAHVHDGYGYSRYCQLYRRWAGRLSPVMRQHHIAGDKMFVDYAGLTMSVVDPATGASRSAQLFVAVLGASSYTFAEATWSQDLSDWAGSHIRAFQFFGGVPQQIVCDNLKSGITKACFHEPTVNQTYQDLARHYQTAVLPARPYKPKDKAKVEVAVQIVERWIIARLRKRRFLSLAELNDAIRECLIDLNNRPSRHLGASRKQLFDDLEAAHLKALPVDPYTFGEWQQCSVGRDYHVKVDDHWYSVPYRLVGEQVWVRIGERTIEVFHRDKRMAAHAKVAQAKAATASCTPGIHRHTTTPDHMPASHRRYAEWTPEKLVRQAKAIGPSTSALIAIILRDKPHPEQGFRASIGILKLAKAHGNDRLEAACDRAIAIGAGTYTSVKSILVNKLDQKQPEELRDGPAITHSNIRGAQYFH